MKKIKYILQIIDKKLDNVKYNLYICTLLIKTTIKIKNMKIILDYNNEMGMYRVIEGSIKTVMAELVLIYKTIGCELNQDDIDYYSGNNSSDDFTVYCHTEEFYNDALISIGQN